MKYALTMAALALLGSTRPGAKPQADGTDLRQDSNTHDGDSRARAAAPVPRRP